MHLFHIPQCFIQNRNVHISVLNGALWIMGQVHIRICELGLLETTVLHYNDVIMSAMASQIPRLTIVYSTVYSICRSQKTSKLRVTGLCERNLPMTGEFSAQRVSNVKNVSNWRRHPEYEFIYLMDSPCKLDWHNNHRKLRKPAFHTFVA